VASFFSEVIWRRVGEEDWRESTSIGYPSTQITRLLFMSGKSGVYWVKPQKPTEEEVLWRDKKKPAHKKWSVSDVYKGEWKGNKRHGMYFHSFFVFIF